MAFRCLFGHQRPERAACLTPCQRCAAPKPHEAILRIHRVDYSTYQSRKEWYQCRLCGWESDPHVDWARWRGQQ